MLDVSNTTFDNISCGTDLFQKMFICRLFGIAAGVVKNKESLVGY